jgi:hypothetical protein
VRLPRSKGGSTRTLSRGTSRWRDCQVRRAAQNLVAACSFRGYIRCTLPLVV